MAWYVKIRSDQCPFLSRKNGGWICDITLECCEEDTCQRASS